MTKSPVELGEKFKKRSNDFISEGDLRLNSCTSKAENEEYSEPVSARVLGGGKEHPQVLIFSLYLKGNV